MMVIWKFKNTDSKHNLTENSHNFNDYLRITLQCQQICRNKQWRNHYICPMYIKVSPRQIMRSKIVSTFFSFGDISFEQKV